MMKYYSLFRMRVIGGLQYRTAAWAGVITQFCWGMLEILLFRAFYQGNAESFPMSFSALVSYIWLQQIFLALYMIWFWENDIFESIESGTIAYELVRPVSIYNMWFSRSLATRVAKTVLRSLPILVIASLLPAPFNLSGPHSFLAFILFLVTMVVALLVVIALNMLVYFLSFFTINSQGLRMVFQSVGDLLTGAIIPLPFFPDTIGKVVSLLPFASIQNVPFRLYSGDLAGRAGVDAIIVQLFWLLALVGIGKLMERWVIKNVVIQGG